MRGSPFFEDVRQIDIEIGGKPGRLPTFYYDCSSMTAAFPARLRGLRELMPDPGYAPARLAPGLGAVVIECLEYRDSDIGSYSELALAVPLSEPGFLTNLPGRALMAAARRGRQHAFIHELPVTTEVAMRGGVDFFNFPKFLAEIDFSEEPEMRRCLLAEGREHILTLSGEHIPSDRSVRSELFGHLWMDGEPQSARFAKNQLEVGTTWRRGAATLELGSRHPIARELERLLVSRKPIRYEYCPRFEAILFGPQRMSPQLVRKVQEAAEALERAAVAG